MLPRFIPLNQGQQQHHPNSLEVILNVREGCRNSKLLVSRSKFSAIQSSQLTEAASIRWAF
ncbi:hypothetical protein HI914_05709 [Erysiphe necator]|nr:hypothetical protein HI914_05709 [Erysiphe necator]